MVEYLPSRHEAWVPSQTPKQNKDLSFVQFLWLVSETLREREWMEFPFYTVVLCVQASMCVGTHKDQASVHDN